MKTTHVKSLLFVAAAFASSGVMAGIHVENVTRDITTKAQQGNTQTMLVQNGMMRTNASSSGAVILKGSTIIMIDDKRKQYREMTKEDLKKMAAGAGEAMAKMQEKMKNMTPEQRAMMEKMMGNRIPGGMGSPDKPDTWESKNLGTTATVEGRKCQNWNLLRNGAPFEELCVVPYNTLPGKEDFQKVFKEMAEAFGDLAKQVPGADQSAKARAAINGYAVRTRMYASDGKFRPTETIMTKWVEESIPASMFEPPAGYVKAELPKRPD
jgi:hypothetical protein